MGNKKRSTVINQGLPGWVMTYGDMMSLLLTFFVLIVSFSSMQEAKFKDAALSLRQAFGVMTAPPSVIEFNDPLMPKYENEKPTDVVAEVLELEEVLVDKELADDVEIRFTGDGLMLRLNAPMLFPPGRTSLEPASHELLDTLAEFLGRTPGEIRIAGHSDPTPIKTSSFPSNWELSAARAGSVARYFHGTGLSPERIAATGYGEFRPLADNSTPEGRARNRRVEIFLRMERNQPQTARVPVSQALDRAGATAPRPTPVTDRLRKLQRTP